MAKDRHFYDRHGNYKGRSSDQGPYDDLAKVLGFLFLLFLLTRGCS
jgi:hypothetical protein